MSFDITADFNAPALGPMTAQVKQQVWHTPNSAIPSITDVEGGQFFYIDSHGRIPGKNCCRNIYKAGKGQMRNQFYHVNLGSPGLPINIQWDWLFEQNFQFAANSTFKIGPCIQWGPISGPTGGVRPMVWANSQGSNASHPKYMFKVQQQRSGGDVTPTVYGPNIVLDQWHTFRIQYFGGPAGFVKFWMDGALVKSFGSTPDSNVHDPVYIDFATFPNIGPSVDIFSRQDNVRIWSGTSDLLVVNAMTLQKVP